MKHKDVTTEVMEKIQKNEVKMRPKTYFVLASIILGIGTLLTIMASAVGIQAIAFHLAKIELFIEVPFWLRVLIFVRIFPWLHLLASLGMVALGLHLLNKFEFSYKTGLMALMIGMGAVIITLSLVFHRVGVDRQLQRQPVIKRIYQVRPVPPEFKQDLIIRHEFGGEPSFDFRMK